MNIEFIFHDIKVKRSHRSLVGSVLATIQTPMLDFSNEKNIFSATSPQQIFDETFENKQN